MENRREHSDGARRPTSRRHFLRSAVLGSIGAMLANTVAVLLYTIWPQKVGAFGGRVVAGRLEDFPLGSMVRVRDGRFYLAHLPEGLLAIYWKCTHLGCTVPWQADAEFLLPSGERLKGIFHCPCHGSVFTRSGQIVAGPAPRPLDLMAVSVEGGKVVVDTGKIVQRERWEPRQALPVF